MPGLVGRGPAIPAASAFLSVTTGLVVLLVSLGYVNYRHTDKRGPVIAAQFASIAALLTGALVFVAWTSPR